MKRVSKVVQEIQEKGKIITEIEKEVIFHTRQLKNIAVEDGQSVYITYVNKADDGEEENTVSIPYESFATVAESGLWGLVDRFK